MLPCLYQKLFRLHNCLLSRNSRIGATVTLWFHSISRQQFVSPTVKARKSTAVFSSWNARSSNTAAKASIPGNLPGILTVMILTRYHYHATNVSLLWTMSDNLKPPLLSRRHPAVQLLACSHKVMVPSLTHQRKCRRLPPCRRWHARSCRGDTPPLTTPLSPVQWPNRMPWHNFISCVNSHCFPSCLPLRQEPLLMSRLVVSSLQNIHQYILINFPYHTRGPSQPHSISLMQTITTHMDKSCTWQRNSNNISRKQWS